MSMDLFVRRSSLHKQGYLVRWTGSGARLLLAYCLICTHLCAGKIPGKHMLRPIFLQPDTTRIHGNKVTLAVVNQLVQHNPKKSYSVNMDESFQLLPQIVQRRLRDLCCQDQIHHDYICMLYLEALLVELTLSEPAEAIVSAALVFRSVLLELQSARFVGYDKQSGVAYLTRQSLKYIGEIRIRMTELIAKGTYLTDSLCFHKDTCGITLTSETKASLNEAKSSSP